MEGLGFFQEIKIPVTVAHVVSVVFGMGAALVSDILFTFFSQDKKLNKTELKTLDILSKVVFYSLFIIAISGIALFLSDVARYSASNKFLAKITILVILILNGYLLNKYVWSHLLKRNFFVSKKERNVRRLAFAMGAISVISWLCVCALGVLDSLALSYPTIISIYGAIILFGVMVALSVERKELN